MDDQPSFGRWLRHRRRLLDLTQEELAQRVGCSVVTIRKIETDERRPSKQIAERLSDVLAIPLAEHAAFIRLARATPGTEAPALPQIPPPLEPSPPATAADAGRVVKGYVLCEPIGEGGFGVVYRAEQPMLGRDVAVKVILPQYANHPDFIRRFEAEAQLVARLEHPHIVPLYDYWREPDRAYLVMRYVRGGNLQATLQPGPLPLDAVARLLEQIGPALALAHRHGVIHRDLKPTNILLDTDGNAYVADFGIAKDLGAANPTDVTQPELILGSPAYLSPEQIKDEPITPQTDIYSLGVLLYESLSGAPPFQSPTPAGLIQKHLSEPLPPLGQQRPDLPAALDAVLQKATAKQPAERYPDVLSLVGAFQRAVAPVRGMRAVGSGRATVDHEPVPTDQRAPPAVAEPPTLANPYKGLRAFAEADAADFFGRAALTQRLLERLAEEHALARFLAVVGPSGSGKSSVVRAGLIPAVRRGGLPGSEEWFIVEVVPGAHPLEELEAALLRVAVNPPASLIEQLQADERGLVRAVKRVLPPNETIDLVLVIDQFEELVTLVDDEATRAQLLASLFAAVTDARSRLRVIVTLRADFYDRPLLYGDFSELVRERTEVVVPLTPAELEQAISGPAERVALALELGLASAIIHDVREQPGALPLLQYALTELVERRVDHTLTMAAYQASGGVLAALGHRGRRRHASCSCDWSHWGTGWRTRGGGCCGPSWRRLRATRGRSSGC